MNTEPSRSQKKELASLGLSSAPQLRMALKKRLKKSLLAQLLFAVVEKSVGSPSSAASCSPELTTEANALAYSELIKCALCFAHETGHKRCARRKSCGTYESTDRKGT